MISKKKKYKKSDFRQTIFFSIFLGVLVLTTIGFMVISNLRISERRAKLNAQISGLKKEIQVLEEKNRELQAGIERSQNESYWEEKIREQGYKKPGEEVTVVLPPQNPSAEENKEEKSFWGKLLDPVKNLLW